MTYIVSSGALNFTHPSDGDHEERQNC